MQSKHNNQITVNDFFLNKQNLFLVLLFIIITLGYYTTVINLLGRWLEMDESQSHGLIIVVLSLYHYFKRAHFARLQNKLHVLAIVALFAVSLLWSIMAAVSIDILEQLLLFALILILQFCLFGSSQGWKLIRPLSLLIFAIPVWDYLNDCLIYISSLVVTYFVQLSGLTVFIEQNSISLPYGSLIIADGCSGLRYLIITLSLAYYVVITSRISLIKSILLMLIAAFFGLITNWIRIYALVIIADQTQMQSGLINDHEIFGWILFLFVLIPIIHIANKLELDSDVNVNKQGINTERDAAPLIFSTLIILTGPFIYHIKGEQFSVPDSLAKYNSMSLTELALTKDTTINEKFPKTSYIFSESNTHDSMVKITINLNWQESVNEKLVPYISGLYNKNRWLIIQTNKISINDISFNELVLKSRVGDNKKILLYTFKVGNEFIAKYRQAKLYAIMAVALSHNEFAEIRLEANCIYQNCEKMSEKLKTSAAVLVEKL